MGNPFVYFLPNVSITEFSAGNGPKVLAAAGLGHLEFRRFCVAPKVDSMAEAAAYCVEAGPGGHPGVLVVPLRPTPSPITAHESATWTEYDGVWIGHDDPPDPESLQRFDYVGEGYPIEDIHGRTWLCPVIRDCAHCTLPKEIEFLPDGGICESPAVNLELSRIADELARHWITDEVTLDLATLATHTVTILATHYRVSKIEINELRRLGRSVLDQRFVQLVTMFTLDNPLANELEKKTPKDGDTTQPGA